MNIIDLEEAADLRVEDVRAYLERKGWTLKFTFRESGVLERDGVQLIYPFENRTDKHEALDRLLGKLANEEGRTPQAVLREMVKRWAPFPTPRTIQAHDHNHGGRWLRRREHDAQVIIDIVSLDGGSDGLPPNLRASSRYWPIDEDGNRVPMPYGGKL